MSSSRSNSSSYSNVSANNLYEVEDELKGSEKSDDEDNANSDNDNMDDNSDIEAYFDEPMADEAWLADYLRRREEDEERQQQLQLRLNGNEPVTSWCSCGNCRIELLQNAKECNCCKEIENCVEFISNFHKKTLKCIVDHPGFPAVCLNMWSLEIAADNYKTRDGKRYSQSGGKQKFLRGVAYRQFTRMVHSRLKDKRIPLPACAYHIIRSTHEIEDEEFAGYEELETSEESE